MTKGWYGDRQKHSMASKGVRTSIRASENYKKEVFNYNNVKEVINELRSGIDASYINIYSSTLGGKDRVSILITISLDSKEEWINGILENSNYMKLDFDKDGSIEYISGNKIGKFRKINSKNINDAINKINRYIYKDLGDD